MHKLFRRIVSAFLSAAMLASTAVHAGAGQQALPAQVSYTLSSNSYSGTIGLDFGQDGTLTVEDGAALVVYGGDAKVQLFPASGAAVELANGTITGAGKAVAIAGQAFWGNGGAAVSGTGVISAGQAFLQGTTAFDANAAKAGKAVDGTVSVTSPYRHVADGAVVRTGTPDPLEGLYWKSGIAPTPPLDAFVTNMAAPDDKGGAASGGKDGAAPDGKGGAASGGKGGAASRGKRSASRGKDSLQTTEVVRHADGSVTTTTADRKTGSVTERTQRPDGSSLTVERGKDGAVVTTRTRADQVGVKTVERPGKDTAVTVTLPGQLGEAIVAIPVKADARTVAEDAELSQTELAAALGIAQTTYSGYERGFREPSLDMLCRIADFFHTSTDYLLGRTDDPAPPDSKPPRR